MRGGGTAPPPNLQNVHRPLETTLLPRTQKAGIDVDLSAGSQAAYLEVKKNYHREYARESDYLSAFRQG